MSQFRKENQESREKEQQKAQTKMALKKIDDEHPDSNDKTSALWVKMKKIYLDNPSFYPDPDANPTSRRHVVELAIRDLKLEGTYKDNKQASINRQFHSEGGSMYQPNENTVSVLDENQKSTLVKSGLSKEAQQRVANNMGKSEWVNGKSEFQLG